MAQGPGIKPQSLPVVCVAMIRFLLLLALLGHAEAVRDMGSILLAEEASMDLEANASQVQAGTVAGAHLAYDVASRRARDAASASSEERRRRQEAFKGTTLRGRYILEELLMAKATPGKSFPTIKEYSGQSPKHLGMGGLGDMEGLGQAKFLHGRQDLPTRRNTHIL
uniref:Uncharacterized protein n=1 Tax=Alexandrium monilatum TaxID=311494 RepID=A0A7S4RSZ7_9DINO